MKRALLTGGSRGLGLDLCRHLLSQQWHVVTLSRRSSPELECLLQAYPSQLAHVGIDLADPNALDHLRDYAYLLQHLNAFIGNAAIGLDGVLTLTSRAAIERCIQLNLTANILLVREAIKSMTGHGGAIVLVSSITARTGFAGLSVYAATKGALGAFCRSIAKEYGPWGIRINCLLPGFFESDMTAGLHQRIGGARFAKRIALQRLGQTSDMLGAISFLLSEEARYITGTEIVVDGGAT